MEKRAARPRKPRVIDTRQSIVTMKRIRTIFNAIRALAPDLVSRSAEPKDIFFDIPLRRRGRIICSSGVGALWQKQSGNEPDS